MSVRQLISQNVALGGVSYQISLIENPTIDDVVITEARLQAAAIEGRQGVLEDHFVSRDIKDFLIRLGVDR